MYACMNHCSFPKSLILYIYINQSEKGQWTKMKKVRNTYAYAVGVS